MTSRAVSSIPWKGVQDRGFHADGGDLSSWMPRRIWLVLFVCSVVDGSHLHPNGGLCNTVYNCTFGFSASRTTDIRLAALGGQPQGGVCLHCTCVGFVVMLQSRRGGA